MIEIIGADLNDKVINEMMNEITKVRDFIIDAIKHKEFKNYEQDKQFSKITNVIGLFNHQLADAYDVHWRYHWSKDYKKKFMETIMDQMESNPFEAMQIVPPYFEVREAYKKECIQTMKTIFPYMDEPEPPKVVEIKKTRNVQSNSNTNNDPAVLKCKIPHISSMKVTHQHCNISADMFTKGIVENDGLDSKINIYVTEKHRTAVSIINFRVSFYNYSRIKEYGKSEDTFLKEFTIVNLKTTFEYLPEEERMDAKKLVYSKCVRMIRNAIHSIPDALNIPYDECPKVPSMKISVKEKGRRRKHFN